MHENEVRVFATRSLAKTLVGRNPGTLPWEFSYPVRRAKYGLELRFTGGGEDHTCRTRGRKGQDVGGSMPEVETSAESGQAARTASEAAAGRHVRGTQKKPPYSGSWWRPRQGPGTDRPHLNRRATSRLYRATFRLYPYFGKVQREVLTTTRIRHRSCLSFL